MSSSGDQQQQNLQNAVVELRQFDLLSVLGVGGYGKVVQVRKAVGNDEGSIYAMKVLKKSAVTNSEKELGHITAEKTVLQADKHPFVVELMYAFQTMDKLIFVMEYLGGGDMHSRLVKENTFNEDVAQFYLSEILLAIEYLHSKEIVYRDLKPENVLLDAEGHIKLSDFGLAKIRLPSNRDTYSFCGTVEYMAPEIVLRSGHSHAADWWSFGILLYDMLSGNSPFSGGSRKLIIEKITNAKLHFQKHISAVAQDLIRKLLKRHPKHRLGTKTPVRSHSFFLDCDWDMIYNRQIKPPFVPCLSSDCDTKWFEKRYTDLSIDQKFLEDNDVVVSDELDESTKNVFMDFDYTSPSILATNAYYRPETPPPTLSPPHLPANTSPLDFELSMEKYEMLQSLLDLDVDSNNSLFQIFTPSESLNSGSESSDTMDITMPSIQAHSSNMSYSEYPQMMSMQASAQF